MMTLFEFLGNLNSIILKILKYLQKVNFLAKITKINKSNE